MTRLAAALAVLALRSASAARSGTWKVYQAKDGARKGQGLIFGVTQE
jgi:hypothetical protein